MAAPKDVKFSIRAVNRTKQAFRGIGRSLTALGRQLRRIQLGTKSLFASVAAGAAISKTIFDAEEVQDLAAAWGTSVEKFDALRQTLVEAGVPARQLEQMLVAIGQQQDLAGSATAGGEAAVRLFDQMGISAERLANAGTADVLIDVLDNLSKIEDKRTVMRELSLLFGRRQAAGALRTSAEIGNIRQFIDEQIKAGRVITTEQAEAADVISTDFANLTRTVKRQIAAGITAGQGPIRGGLQSVEAMVGGGVAAGQAQMTRSLRQGLEVTKRDRFLERIANATEKASQQALTP